jgi:hypothetical protein
MTPATASNLLDLARQWQSLDQQFQDSLIACTDISGYPDAYQTLAEMRDAVIEVAELEQLQQQEAANAT